MYWTEGGPDFADPDTFTSVLRSQCRSITAWNFALDERDMIPVSFENPDGQRILVVTNAGAAIAPELAQGRDCVSQQELRH